MKLRTLLAIATLSLGVSACGSEPVTEPVQDSTVEISGLYVSAPAPGRDVTGGGMKVTANGEDFRLVSVTSDAAESVEMHTMVMENDMMDMQQVKGFDIADGETLELAPGGPHLMLFGFDKNLRAGDTSEMLFTFETADGETVTLNYKAEIRGKGEH